MILFPVYTDTPKEDYRLSDKSPLMEKGFNTWDDESIDAPTIDLIGLARPSPSGSSVDMGAYENSLAGSSSPLPVSGFVAARYTNGAKLSWTKNKKSLGSSDDAENVQYQIYSDGSLKGTTTGTAFTITGLTNGTAYKVSVAALDTTTKLEGAPSAAISVTPRYLGPWYVAAGSGAAVSDTSDSYEVGSSSTPMSHLKGAIEIAASGDTIILKEGTHSGSSDRGRDWNNSKKLVIMGDPSLTADKIIIDAKGKDRHFTFDNQEDTTTQIIGLTLKNGYDSERAGSIYIGYASVKLKGVIFQNNIFRRKFL
jgi:Fibronectin type III domain.